MTKEPRQGLAAEALRLVASCRQAGQDKTIIQDEEHDDWIHLTRVGTKRLRSAWHLMRDVVGVDRAQQARERLRQISAAVSTHRDRHVRLKAIRHLKESPLPKTRRSSRRGKKAAFSDPVVDWQLLETVAEKEMVSTEKVNHSVLENLWKAEASDWETVRTSPEEERKAIRRGLRRSQRKVRNLTVKAANKSDPLLWHDWRKKVKRLRYQQEMVAQLQGRKPGRRLIRLARLGTMLGERNDLVALRHWLTAGTVRNPGTDISAALEVIGSHESSVMNRAEKLGRSLLNA